MGTDILTEIRAAGITLSVDGGNLVATPKAAITDDIRTLIRAHKPDILAVLARTDSPSLPDAAASRRQILSPAALADLPPEDPACPLWRVSIVRAKALSIEFDIRSFWELPDWGRFARRHYGPFATVLARPLPEPEPDTEGQGLWWRIAITEPDGRTVEADAPSGWTLADAQAYAARRRRTALRASCEGVAGITPTVFRSLLSPEDLDDIEGGHHPAQDSARLCPVIRRRDPVGARGVASGVGASLREVVWVKKGL